MENETLNCISTALVALMFLGLIAVFIERFINGKGIGARTIQIISILLIIPMIGILALQGVLESQTTATLIGALTGYLLSGIGNFTPSSKSSEKSD